VVGRVGGGNSSSKVFSFADRPKVKIPEELVISAVHCCCYRVKRLNFSALKVDRIKPTRGTKDKKSVLKVD
jgi:hypothetical protein